MSETPQPDEVGYGTATKEQRAATFFDALLYATARKKLNQPAVKRLCAEIDPETGFTKQVLLARAAQDLENVDGKLVVRIITGKGEQFVIADEFSLQTPNGPAEKKVAAVLIDIDSPLLLDNDREISTGEAGMRQILDGVVTAQAKIETHPGTYFTRNEYWDFLDQPT